MMKDGLALLLAGAVCAALAWAFWHYLGEDAGQVFTIVVMVGLIADNVRLRRRLRAKR